MNKIYRMFVKIIHEDVDNSYRVEYLDDIDTIYYSINLDQHAISNHFKVYYVSLRSKNYFMLTFKDCKLPIIDYYKDL